MNLRERLLSRLIVDPSGCLLWQGEIDRYGYGRIPFKGRNHLVHRVMWELLEGPIPDGMELDHVKARGCHHRNCANVAHLEPVTHRENTLRGDTISAINAAKTHCPNDHLYDDANTYRARGQRQCRACNRDAVRRYKARRKATQP